jgi:hypothetical protein
VFSGATDFGCFAESIDRLSREEPIPWHAIAAPDGSESILIEPMGQETITFGQATVVPGRRSKVDKSDFVHPAARGVGLALPTARLTHCHSK